jgi:15-cis-phytoene synthase
VPRDALLPAFVLDRKARRIGRRRLASGSRSFSLASWLLPRHLRAPTTAFYAFCREADDLVDAGDAAAGVVTVQRRVDEIYGDASLDDAIDRGMRAVVRSAGVPRTVVDALVEGFAWDATGRRYETLADVSAYCARVASTVGVVMCRLLGHRECCVLARACDLGVAMQLTNIARDVGEDARRGRLYLPRTWIDLDDTRLEAWLARPIPHPAVSEAVLRLLDVADVHYRRADSGIEQLPARVRPSIRAARRIYADIARLVRARGGDSVSTRAVVPAARKLRLLWSGWRPGPFALELLETPACAATRFLVEAAAEHGGR